MSEPQQVQWTGASGTKYTYWVYSLPTNLNSEQDGNCIFTKFENSSWKPIYIRQGDRGTRTNIDNHHQSTCLRSKGATHLHAHKNAVERDRLSEVQDLHANYPQAYKPMGCNEKTGG
jgi:hypothetical protein